MSAENASQQKHCLTHLPVMLLIVALLSILATASQAQTVGEKSRQQLPEDPQTLEIGPYELGSGDRVRVIVFGEDELSGEFEIDSSGRISMPLIGTVAASGTTTRGLEERIVVALKDGYLKNPRVGVEVLNYRPFYILGEVINPGSYPYRTGLTVLNAVVMSGGYTDRGNENDITIVRAADPEKQELRVTPYTPVSPGDIVRIHRRFFY